MSDTATVSRWERINVLFQLGEQRLRAAGGCVYERLAF